MADFQTALATKITTGGTSTTIQSVIDDDGEYLDNGEYFFTIDGDNSSKEHILCSLDTPTSTISSIYSVSRQGKVNDTTYTYPNTPGVSKEHRVGASVMLTDHGHIKVLRDLMAGAVNLNADTPLSYDDTASITNDNQLATKGYVDTYASSYALVDANQSVFGIKSFEDELPISEHLPTTGNQLTNKDYVDATAIFGAPLADSVTSGIVEEATETQVIAGDYEGETGARLYVNPKTLKDAGIVSHTIASVQSVVPLPVDIPNYATNTFGGIQTPNNTVAYIGLVNIPYFVTVDKIILNLTAVTANGSVQMALYSEDGQTKYISEYIGEITGGTTSTAYNIGSTSLDPGYYYLAFKSEADINVNAWTSSSNIFNGYVDISEGTTTVFSGETTVGAGALPATIEPRSITPQNSRIIAIKLT